MLRRTLLKAKKVGKPADAAPEYKQAYLPYEVAPTAAELEKERARFSSVYYGRQSNRKSYPVANVPKNMYTYGKEGMTLPIAIFKNQPDPVIAPEWTYPGIYENKIAARHYYMEELSEMAEKDNFPSPWLRNVLNGNVNSKLRSIKSRMALMKIRELQPLAREKTAQAKGKAGGAKKK
jgi:hypothetical protein